MKEIRIKFKDDTLKAIAGNDFGYATFNSYRDKILKNESVELIFPEEIVLIASSFMQGFMREIREDYISGRVTISGGKDNCAHKYFKEEMLND